MTPNADSGAAIRPFVLDVPGAAVDDLHRRIDATRWPARGLVTNWDRGVPLEYLHELADYWRHTYDWRAQERTLNGWAQFTTEIDEQQIHFLHVRSPEADATPILLSHGWPGSVVEFMRVIEPLTDPRAHGGDPADAFHVVAPSLPGFGFSLPLRSTGWTVRRIATAFTRLMARLGYDRYGVQGGDWGSAICCDMGIVDPDHVLGVHLNMLFAGGPRKTEEIAALSDADKARLARSAYYEAELSGYYKQQTTRPETVGYALNDSPVGLLAWIVEKFHDWTDSRDVPEDAVDRDQMLTNVMLYWLGASATSSANLYYEMAHQVPPRDLLAVPTGVAIFAHDVTLPLRTSAEKHYTNIVSWNEYDRGGHFAAMEQPRVLVEDVRSFFRSVR